MVTSQTGALLGTGTPMLLGMFGCEAPPLAAESRHREGLQALLRGGERRGRGEDVSVGQTIAHTARWPLQCAMDITSREMAQRRC
jgi:hypothetical protein